MRKSLVKKIRLLIAVLTCTLFSMNTAYSNLFANVVVLAAGADKSVDPQAKPLKYAAKDAGSFAEAMKKFGQVPSTNIIVEQNASLDTFETSLKASIEKFRQSADLATSKFIFFFSGHADERGLHFKDGFFSNETLDRYIGTLPAKTKVLILDTCFAGLLSNKGVKSSSGFGAPKIDFDEPSGSIYLTASSSSDFAYESSHLKSGLFSKAIIEGLSGKADANGDGVVTATELYEYAFRETRLASHMISVPAEQNPEFVSNLRGRGAIAMSYPSQINGQVKMAGDLRGKMTFFAAKGLNIFDHQKKAGRDETISVPPGAYQVEVRDGERHGLADLRVMSSATSMLTIDDLTWIQPDRSRTDIAPRGIESSVVTDAEKKRSRQLLAGSMGVLSRSDFVNFQLALMSRHSSHLTWPIVAMEYARNLARDNSDDFSLGKSPNILSCNSLLLGIGLPLWSQTSETLTDVITAGGRFFDVINEPKSDVRTGGHVSPIVRNELNLSFAEDRFFVAGGAEWNGGGRYIGDRQNKLPSTSIVMRVGSAVKL